MKCFLPNTGLRLSDRSLVPVQHLTVASTVLSTDQQMLQVTSCRKHPKRTYKVVEISTDQGSLICSATHRVRVDSIEGEKEAKDVDRNDTVFVGDRPLRVTRVKPMKLKTELYEIHFEPDFPVETFGLPEYGLHTLGSQNDAQFDVTIYPIPYFTPVLPVQMMELIPIVQVFGTTNAAFSSSQGMGLTQPDRKSVV